MNGYKLRRHIRLRSSVHTYQTDHKKPNESHLTNSQPHSNIFSARLPQVDENKPSKHRIGVHSGVCIHNGIVHKNGDEWTVDDCTECTCRVRTRTPLPPPATHTEAADALNAAPPGGN